jgi:hypothetical protein
MLIPYILKNLCSGESPVLSPPFGITTKLYSGLKWYYLALFDFQMNVLFYSWIVCKMQTGLGSGAIFTSKRYNIEVL